jgi:hypothetical protein
MTGYLRGMLSQAIQAGIRCGNLWDMIIETNKELESNGVANEDSRISKVLTNINITVGQSV